MYHNKMAAYPWIDLRGKCVLMSDIDWTKIQRERKESGVVLLCKTKFSENRKVRFRIRQLDLRFYFDSTFKYHGPLK